MYLVVGFVLGMILVTMISLSLSKKIVTKWYDWLLGLIGLILLLFTLQNYFASTATMEPMAPRMFLLVFGIPAVIIVATSFLLVWQRQVRIRKSMKQP
jgi:hypothetical protein